MKLLPILSLIAALATIPACASPSASSPAVKSRCTSTPCPNTQTGEDPEQEDIRKGAEIEARLLSDPDDKKRWNSLILFSDSTDKRDLSMPIIKVINFNVTLEPDRGWLTFTSPKSVQTFKIASLPGVSNNPCPDYQIRVVEGGPDFAIIRKTCPESEYRPGRFYKSNDYYLYDLKSATMRTLWSASSILGKGPSPIAKPDITVSKINDGYSFSWTGLFPSDNPPVKMTIRNVYKRESDGKGGQTLACFDTRKSGQPIKENEMCEGQVLERVIKAK